MLDISLYDIIKELMLFDAMEIYCGDKKKLSALWQKETRIYNVFYNSKKAMEKPLMSVTANKSNNDEGKNKDNVILLFIAIRGFSFDAHNEIDRLQNYCNCFVVDQEYLKLKAQEIMAANALFLVVSDTRRAMAYIYKVIYKRVDEKLQIYAVTGTDGKTSVVTIARDLFNSCKIPSTSIGTLGYFIKGQYRKHERTTPEIYDMFPIFNECFENGIYTVFLEATSIGAVLSRLSSISFDALAFTNMTEDHLDFHKSLDAYYEAKLLFIDQLHNSSKPYKWIVYNKDDSNYGLIKMRSSHYIDLFMCEFGFKNSFIAINNSYYKDRIQHIDFLVNGKQMIIKTNLIGIHNAQNIAVAIAFLYRHIVILEKQSENAFIDALKNSEKTFLSLRIPGRLMRTTYSTNDIFVDYAHTEESLKTVLSMMRNVGYDKIITVMGCGGDRDRQKRPKMGKVAQELSEQVIITSDNPRNEDPEDIIKEILTGINKGKDNVIIIVNRKEAIQKAFSLLKKNKNSALLLAGKGHEDYQEIKGVKYPFSDSEILDECIAHS